jgi:nicotinamidase-related amidase
MDLTLNLRTRFEVWKGSDRWEEAILPRTFPAHATALLLCDMWDDHWCKSAARRSAGLAHTMNPILATARDRGVQIIHAPSECMEFYRDTPQRRRMAGLPAVGPVPTRQIDAPALPIDDSDGGCDDHPQCPTYHAWTRQHPAITIEEPDVISDSGVEIYSLLRQRNIHTLLVAGVHTNFCVLGRSFGIRQMSRWGIDCVLVRDLTDSLYNPAKPPFVSHEDGTELVIRHIEQYWCPSILSDDLIKSEQD